MRRYDQLDVTVVELRKLIDGMVQNALLAEIIKVNAPNPQVLLNIINNMNMSPRLEELPLPHGPYFQLHLRCCFLAAGLTKSLFPRLTPPS